MVVVLFGITFIYIILIGIFIIGFDTIEVFNDESLNEVSKFSIIIPFRNEADNLPDLLQSIYNLDYQKKLFEILLIDDDSEDNSVEIINTFINKQSFDSTRTNIQIFKNNRTSDSPKKDAIITAIHNAKNEWIITTDADCIVPIMWLKTFDLFIRKNNPKMIVAPVTYSIDKTLFQNFQLLDFLSLQSATIAGFGIKNPFLCNSVRKVNGVSEQFSYMRAKRVSQGSDSSLSLIFPA